MASSPHPTMDPQASRVANKSVDVGEELFASENQHSEFRGICRLIQELDCHLPVAHGLHITRDDEKGDRRNDYEFGQEIFAHLLIRQKEVTAAALTTRIPTTALPATVNGEISRIDSPQIIIASNPETRGRIKPKKGETETTKTVVWARSDFEALDTSPGVVAAVLQSYPDYADSKGIAPFRTHVGWSQAFLQRCHAGDIDQTRYTQLRQEYKDYVYLACYPKMHMRLKWGSASSNFLKILTANEQDFFENAFDGDINADYGTILPTADQASFIKQYCRIVGHSAGHAEDAIAASAEKYSKAPLYNKEGRNFLHYMMSTIVKAAADEIINLDAVKKRWSSREETIDNVLTAVRRAQDAMTNLNLFINYFAKVPFGQSNSHDILSIHLSWLARITAIKGRTDTPDFTGSSAKIVSELSSLAPGLPESSESHRSESSEKNKDEGGDGDDEDVDSRNSDDQDDQDDGLEEEESEKADNDEEVDQLIDSVEHLDLHKSGWARGVLKFLDVWCLHEQSFQSACPSAITNRDPAKSSHIRNAKVTVVDIELYKTKRHTMKSSLQAVLEMDTELAKSTAVLQSILERPTAAEPNKNANTFWNNNKHDGKVHCETILMTAMYLMKHKVGGEDVTQEDKAWLERNGIFGIDISLLRLLRYPLEILIVSKRCCPPCWKVFEMMNEKDLFVPKPNKVAMPGYHTRWAVTVLPPYMLKEHVEEMLRWAKEEALKRLRKLEQAEKEKTSSSRGTADGKPGTLVSSEQQDEMSGSIPLDKQAQADAQKFLLSSSPAGPVPPSDPPQLTNASVSVPIAESAPGNVGDGPRGVKRGADEQPAGPPSPEKKGRKEGDEA